MRRVPSELSKMDLLERRKNSITKPETNTFYKYVFLTTARLLSTATLTVGQRNYIFLEPKIITCLHFSVTVNIIEESQYPPIITPLDIEILSYQDDFPGSIVGKIKASDQDPYDVLGYELLPSFSTINLPPTLHLFEVKRKHCSTCLFLLSFEGMWIKSTNQFEMIFVRSGFTWCVVPFGAFKISSSKM